MRDLEAFRARVAALERMEAANIELFESIRAEILNDGAEIFKLGGVARGDGYDYLDELILGVLQFDEPGEEGPRRAEMVPYQPTPARHIFDLLGRVELGAGDVLMDLGSGLGHVALMAAICTKARCIGIELEPAYVECARRSAAGLNLSNVKFVEQDARAADLSAGTVFYLYTPFTGTILRAVLDLLRREAESRQIRVCTYGPCTMTVAEEPWLEAGRR